jgi:hypothetical protein
MMTQSVSLVRAELKNNEIGNLNGFLKNVLKKF